MKKIFLTTIAFIFLVAFSNGQANRFLGTWQGTLNVGIELRIVFHVQANPAGGFISTAESPDQSAAVLKCDSTVIDNNRIRIVMKDLSASYSGEILNDSTISGEFLQRSALPLVLKKNSVIAKRPRPQTLTGPFPYKSEEVLYSKAGSTISFGATITIPEGKGPFPAILLITGSGAQDRDETILDHKPFAVIADHLTRKGFIVLRVDDRGVGKSTGDFGKATSEDFAADASCGVDYLLSRADVNKKKVGLIGHSEGGMIAPIVATKRKDIDFIVLMAGPGVKIIDLMAEQNEAIARSAGVPEEELKLIKPFFKTVVMSILAAPDSSTAQMAAEQQLENWAQSIKKESLLELNISTPTQRSHYIAEMIRQIKSPWFNYFIRFDPAPYLEQLKCKVLALNGSKDIQVVSSQNLPGIAAALKNGGNKNYDIMELKGLNHFFQSCKKCTIQDYGELEETIAPTALELISTWLEKKCKITVTFYQR